MGCEAGLSQPLEVPLKACVSHSLWQPSPTPASSRRNWHHQQEQGRRQVTGALKPVARGRWDSSALEGSSSRGRKTLIPNLRCLAAIQKRLQEGHLEEKTRSGAPKAVVAALRLHPATAAVDLAQVVLVHPFPLILPATPRGGHCSVGCPVSPYSPAEAFSAPGELTSSGVAWFRHTQRDEAVTGCKFRPIGVTSERQGPRSTVGEALQLHWVGGCRRYNKEK